MSDATGAPTVEPDYDTDVWIEVPLEFPVADLGTDEDWAEALVEDALRANDGATGVAESVRDAAIAVARHPSGLASRRFWYFPLVAKTLSLVHFFELPRESALEEMLVEFLGSHDHRSTDPVVTELMSAHGERIVRVAFLAREGEGDMSQVYGVMRVARLSEASIDLFELVDEDLFAASTVIGDVEKLAVSIGRGPYRSEDDMQPLVVEAGA